MVRGDRKVMWSSEPILEVAHAGRSETFPKVPKRFAKKIYARNGCSLRRNLDFKTYHYGFADAQHDLSTDCAWVWHAGICGSETAAPRGPTDNNNLHLQQNYSLFKSFRWRRPRGHARL
jgi:hypothetical protein